jgi:hypothetical protein
LRCLSFMASSPPLIAASAPRRFCIRPYRSLL